MKRQMKRRHTKALIVVGALVLAAASGLVVINSAKSSGHGLKLAAGSHLAVGGRSAADSKVDSNGKGDNGKGAANANPASGKDAAAKSNKDPASKDNKNPAPTTTKSPAKDQVKFQLTPTNGTIAKCLPYAIVKITVKLQDDALGRDVFKVDASGLPPKTSFTVFLVEQPATPFGAVEYIGDADTDRYGRAHAELRLIVQEAFASTLVNGNRVRVDLNHVGMWFADPAGDDFCLGKGAGTVTPFDGDGQAGVQAFNSAIFLPGAPLP